MKSLNKLLITGVSINTSAAFMYAPSYKSSAIKSGSVSSKTGNTSLMMAASGRSITKSTKRTILEMSTIELPPVTDTVEEGDINTGSISLEEFYNGGPIEEKKSYLDDGFVFGLEGSGIERPKGKVASVVVEGDSLETKPYQVAMVALTFACHLSLMGLNIAELFAQNGGDVTITLIQAVSLVVSSWVLADLGSGVLHWSVDNYGNGRTPVMGSIIAAFQGHHSAPWTITQRGFCNNVYKLCIPFGIPTMLLINQISGPMTTVFFAVFCMMEILSQELHKWSHTTKSEVPGWVNMLQDAGVSIGRKPHALHHTAPYDGNYCIISGICNKPLDESGFFRRLEHMVYNINGVESNAWKLDAELREKTLSGKYRLNES